jgi:hypothetical protein
LLTRNIPDTTRIDILIRLADSYLFIDFQKSTQFAKEAERLAIKSENKNLKYRTNQQLALNHGLRGDFTSALNYETKACS